jgi:RNA-binding protein
VSKLELTGHQRRYLRGLAHPLKPVVRVGKGGVTDSVALAVERALVDHELVKVRMLRPEDKRGCARLLADRCGAHLCGLVGHTVILYRAHPETPRIRLPERGRAARSQAQTRRAVTIQAAESSRTPSGDA